MRYYLIDCELEEYLIYKGSNENIFNSGYKVIAFGNKDEIIEKLLSLFDKEREKIKNKKIDGKYYKISELLVYKHNLTSDGEFEIDTWDNHTVSIKKDVIGHDEVKDELNKIIDVNYESFGKEDYRLYLAESNEISKEQSHFINDFIIITEQEYADLLI